MNRDLRYLRQAFSRLRKDVMQSGAFDGLFDQQPLRQRGQLIAVDGAEEDDLTVYQPMALAPWNLFWPLLVGALVVISGTLPVAILQGWNIHRMLGEQFAGGGAPGATSGLLESTFLATSLFKASVVPWMLFGMGIILFSVGRFFGTIRRASWKPDEW